MSIQRYYKFKEEDTIASLELFYDKSAKRKLRYIKDQDNNHIQISQIWINNIPALHIRRFHSSIPHNEKGDYEKKGNHHYLDFKGDWSWLSGKDWRSIDILYIWKNEEKVLKDLPSCLKASGITKYLEECIGKPGNQFLLYFEGRPLREGMSIGELAEVNIGSKYAIDVFVPSDLKKGLSTQQKATGGSSRTIPAFESYIEQMRKKIGIVCQIEIPIPSLTKKSAYGTGFLIGPSLIMTNEHVIHGYLVESKLNSAKAKFLYHHDQAEIVVDIASEVICSSISPGENRHVRSTALDYAILRLETRGLTASQLLTLYNLGRIGKKFYQKALDAFNTRQSSIDAWRANPKKYPDFRETLPKQDKQRRKRANIIQHPLKEKISQPKRIAFRDNRAHAVSITLHYLSKTADGSSGAPVINDSGDWIGMHYSSCFEFNKELFKYVYKLCEKLGYQFNQDKTTFEALCFVNVDKELYIQRSPESQGQYSETFDGPRFTLVELISRNQPIKTTLAIASCVHTFLREQGVRIVEDHTFCNTAIAVEAILKDLEKNQKDKMDKAIQKTQQEWETLLEKIKTEEEAAKKTQQERNQWSTRLALCWTRNRNYCFVGIASLAAVSIAAAIYRYQARK